MLTFQGMRMRTAYMMEVIRQEAIEETLEKWKVALKNYYTIGYDNGESVKLYKELERLGADTEQLFDIDFEIRETCK